MSPRPIHIASYANLLKTWNASPDSKRKVGTAGIDQTTPAQFKNNLQRNLNDLSNALKNNQYKFSDLRPFFIEKGNGKERVIAAPTVKDRIVQRLILRQLTYDAKNKKTRDRLGIIVENISFGIGKGMDTGVHGAIKQAVKYRNKHSWVLKTDISAFFDNIPRETLKKLIRSRLKSSSLTPLIEQVIDCEIRVNGEEEKNKIKKNGIHHGLGLRQGMPLSPLLSNLVLNKLDKKIKRKNYKIIRYADDLIGFGHTEEECIKIKNFIQRELKKLELEIPDLKDQETKTQIKGPNKEVIFLGVEIYKDKTKYKCKIPKKTWDSAVQKVKNLSDADWCMHKKYTYDQVIKILNDIPSGYAAAFSDCTNLPQLVGTLKKEISSAKKQLISNIFGANVINALTLEQKRFMNISI